MSNPNDLKKGRLSEEVSSEDANDRGRAAAHDSRVDELADERATHQYEDAPWERPSNLEAPPPRPGMMQRWIRFTLEGEEDPRNVSRKMREGWRPRSPDTIPADFMAGSSVKQADLGRLVVDDLMLCEMPAERYQQRKRYYDAQTRNQMEAVEHDLDGVQQPGHRIVRDRQSQVELGSPANVRGRHVEVAPD